MEDVTQCLPAEYLGADHVESDSAEASHDATAVG